MRVKISLLPALAATVVLVLATACVAVDTTSGTPTPTPLLQSPTPTPISPEARQTALEFARSYQGIEQDWEQFHSDFNQWRVSLVSCERASAEVALIDFADEFNNVLQQARNLPRSSTTRGLADQLVKAAENEGEALRQLRDKWQPSNTVLFAAVETQRSAAAAAQQEVLDRLMDLRDPPGPGSVGTAPADAARVFSQAFEQINQDWEQFHNNYNSLRDQQETLSPADVSTRLSSLVDEFSSVVSAIDSLPSSGSTDGMATQLKEAAQAEDNALKELLSNFPGQAETPPAQTETPPGQTETPPDQTGTTDGSEGGTASNGNDPFAAMNDLVSKSDGVREQVQNDLQNLPDATASGNISDVDNFRQQYDVLAREWNEFHQGYDEWRSSEGGCNRTEVIGRLGQFSVRFSEIAREVRNLPSTSFVRPMADTLVEAAEREEEALRGLRNTWRPFATDAYRAVDQERTNADSLRRQANVGIQELLQRFGIPASEI
jgi:hypothetical protein